jgi:cysteine desulfurase/selenocysteine lyase
MIRTVSFERTTYAAVPQRFEAGTPNIAGVVGLAAANDYVTSRGLDEIARHEHTLLGHATQAVAGIPGLRVIGTAAHKAGILSFVIDGIHPHDLGTILDTQGVAIRAGHHCAMPVMTRFGIPGTARASLAAYNTEQDVAALVDALNQAVKLFGTGRAA